MPPERFETGPDYEDKPDLAIVALLSMLARYPHTRCERMSDSILAHLRYIAFDQRYAPAIRAAAGRIFHEWRFLHTESPTVGAVRQRTVN